jgi:hypothetical protein
MPAGSHLTDGLAVFDSEFDPARLFVPISALAVIRTVPWWRRRWDPALRCWLINSSSIEALTAALRDAGYEVDLHLPDGTTQTFKPTGAKTVAK